MAAEMQCNLLDLGDMKKVSIADRGWLVDVVGRAVFLATAGVVLYVWPTSVRPLPSHVVSALMYFGIFVALVGAIARLLAIGFTYRRTDITGNGLVVHEGYYGIFWRQHLIPKSQITAVEPYDEQRPTVFGRVWVSGIRIRRNDHSAIILSEREGQSRFQQEVAEMCRLLGVS
jgi:hypothetical protein